MINIHATDELEEYMRIGTNRNWSGALYATPGTEKRGRYKDGTPIEGLTEEEHQLLQRWINPEDKK